MPPSADVKLARNEVVRPIVAERAFVPGAETIHFLVWGVILFPQGNLVAKAP